MYDEGAVLVGADVSGVDLAGLFGDPSSCAEAWAQASPSGLLLDVLTGLSPDHLDADGALEAMAAADRVVSLAQAVQARLLARFAALRPQDGDEPGGVAVGGAVSRQAFSEFAADEVAPVLRVSRNAASGRLALAADLNGRLRATLAALERGDIDGVKARVVSDGVARLPDEQARAVEARVLPKAGSWTAAQLRAAVRRAVARVDPEGASKREALARSDRRLTLTPVADGMAELWALLPAADATAAYRRVDQLARACAGEDGRSADQRRADCLTDLLLDGVCGGSAVGQPGDGGGSATSGSRAGVRAGVRVNVHVTVAASTLVGLDDEPGDLAGHGPITARTARELASGALSSDTRWRRLLTDPVAGQVLDVGRRTYRPPAALADLVRARDGCCRFPGCRVSADRCDLDHTVEFPRGATSVVNLGSECRHHHRLKHETDWRLVQHEDGVFTWVSPTGRRYTTTPEPPLDPPPAPAPPPGCGRPRVRDRKSSAGSAKPHVRPPAGHRRDSQGGGCADREGRWSLDAESDP